MPRGSCSKNWGTVLLERWILLAEGTATLSCGSKAAATAKKGRRRHEGGPKGVQMLRRGRGKSRPAQKTFSGCCWVSRRCYRGRQPLGRQGCRCPQRLASVEQRRAGLGVRWVVCGAAAWVKVRVDARAKRARGARQRHGWSPQLPGGGTPGGRQSRWVAPANGRRPGRRRRHCAARRCAPFST